MGQHFDNTKMIGKRPVEWQVSDWFNSEPISLKSLRGGVIMVRWWTGPHCQFCIASSTALNEFYNEFDKLGLTIIGFYHHKSLEPINKGKVENNIETLGFKFPVAIDYDWKTLRSWWLQGGPREFTSVTFLIDRKGLVRFVHPGGKYEKNDNSYKLIRSLIKSLLDEKV
ncbi:MAG: alkyl hydroperoxide reductase [Candidatus Marinimicrobia bacterium]|nr:alkyl hydroperoxide reductase [Candidatus Neomarinimicrobiota bacterium]|tara:strand:- start:1100 stop:1606 length:507 start_codon:yes stop_codon:yes gene_type:complete